MSKKMMLLGMSMVALAGCGIQIYEYPESLGGQTIGSSFPSSVNASPKTTAPITQVSPTPAPSYNRNPLILSFTANPLNVVNPGDSVTFTIDVIDEDHDNLKYTWSSTGGTLSSTTGRLVSYTPPARAGIYTVLVSISDGKGGTAEGAQNIVVKSDGSAALSGQPAIANN